MRTTLLCLHGFTQNGAVMRAHMQELLTRLPGDLIFEFPDGPHTCSEASVRRMYSRTRTSRLSPPHLYWWDATDDGLEYRGWEATRERLAAVASGAERVGVLGFSQGAIVAAAITALAEAGEFPNIAFAIFVAGRVPRASLFESVLERRLRTASLHVWGEQDVFGRALSSALVEHFDPASCEVVVWPGPHVVPTRGPAADAIVEFIVRQLPAS